MLYQVRPKYSIQYKTPHEFCPQREQHYCSWNTGRVRCLLQRKGLYVSDRMDVISRPLEDGDIINIDITVFLDGYHGDTSQTFLVGNVVRCIPLSNTSPNVMPGSARTRTSGSYKPSVGCWDPRMWAWKEVQRDWEGNSRTHPS